MFKEERSISKFEWNMLGDVKVGRPNLGEYVKVDVYRLMQFTMRDEMIKNLGVEQTDKIFYDAGKNAGQEFMKNVVGKKESFDAFVEAAQTTMRDLLIGVLRVEKANMEDMKFTLTVAEDLDCSGLPVTDEEICVYDEGFIAGMLYEQTGVEFTVTEVDCWCSGDRVCRFNVQLSSDDK